MAKHIVKNNQNIVDLTMMTYGNQQAVFKLAIDNGINSIPNEFVPGKTIEYDATDMLFDINIYKIRQREKGIEVATTNNVLLARGSFNKSFNISFK